MNYTLSLLRFLNSFLNKKYVLSCLLICLNGCASFEQQATEIKNQVRNGQIDSAVQSLAQKVKDGGKDQLIYALDYATVLQIAEKYKESSEAFIHADRILSEKDYHSVSQVVGSALGSEEMIQYKGESYEKFLLNSLNAINYLMLNDYDAALVECRRINNKIKEFKMDGREPYEFSPWARYLSAMIWEAQKNYDDAYIEYQEAYKLNSQISWIQTDLIRSAQLAGRDEEVKKWKSQFKLETKDLMSRKEIKSKGELILIHQAGFAPKKVPRHDEYRFPTLMSEYYQTQKLKLVIEKDGHVMSTAQTNLVYNIDEMAKLTLAKDYGSLIARRVGGVVAKAVVSDQIRQKNELLGQLAWIAMNVSDRADLRQWATLPAQIRLSKQWLEPGDYELSIYGQSFSDDITGEVKEKIKFKIESGKKVFLNYRTLK